MRPPALNWRVGRPQGSTLHVPLATFAILLVSWCHAQRAINPARDLVNPFIGTGGHGHTFPGACVPNGLVQLSPDTRPDGYMDWDGCGGYHYSDSVIHGFSHTHLSGTGVADLCDVLITPVVGMDVATFDHRMIASRFDHTSEEANAGYYKVELDGSASSTAKPNWRDRIVAELTATQRVGVHRYGFPKGGTGHIIVDLRHRDKIENGEMKLVGNNEIVGERRSSSWAKDQRLFFCIRFSEPWHESKVMPNVPPFVSAGLTFGVMEKPLMIKVGISAVSIEGARKNLDAEVPHWDFDKVRAEAETAWNTKLNRIKVEGGTPEQQRVFYTALYHTYVAPYIFNDVDGQYRGIDGQVHKADHKVYTVFSLWDTFRGLHPLMTILEPEMTNDWIKTFLGHYMQSGRLPVWELWGNETDCMIGYHSASVIADAQMKGIRGFDEELALEAMREGARMQHFGLGAYGRKGFMSSEDGAESVSRTLEYAYDDACIAAFISRLEQRGGDQEGLSFGDRSNNWKNLFDTDSRFFRARRNGGFAPGFDPYEVNFNFTEANAWQYSLFVPHDIEGLMELHGGRQELARHLDRLFSAQASTSGREQADITGLIGQYAHGNEPSHHMAYLYNHVGKPEKTRALVRRIMDEFYHDAPDGLIGNEDCGQMSAWYVLSALGFYPVSPGTDFHYSLGYPLFDKATVALADGRSWSMVVKADADKAPVDSAGHWSSSPRYLSHFDLMRGGEMIFGSDRAPMREWHVDRGTSESMSVPDTCSRPGAPVIEAMAATFTDSLQVLVRGCGRCVVKDEFGERACSMDQAFTVTNTSDISVEWHRYYAPIQAHFARIDGSRTIELTNRYANQYSAGGDNALIDGLRGGTDFRTGEWQGYEGLDLVAMIDLGSVKKLKRAGLSVLQDQKSWIFLPKEVTVSWSTNKRQWSSRTIVPAADAKAEGGFTYELWTEELGKKARYISIVAKNFGPCPEWHVGKGGKTWIFADEVLIETE